MGALNLTQAELATIERVCRHIEIDDCTPPYLQDFIAGRLAGRHPRLSRKVRGLGQAEMDELCEHLKVSPASP